MAELERTCQNCYFWGRRLGEKKPHKTQYPCHYAPPTLEGKRPQVDARDWCGQWRYVKDPTPQERDTWKANAIRSVPGMFVSAAGQLVGGGLVATNAAVLMANDPAGGISPVGLVLDYGQPDFAPRFVPAVPGMTFGSPVTAPSVIAGSPTAVTLNWGGEQIVIDPGGGPAAEDEGGSASG